MRARSLVLLAFALAACDGPTFDKPLTLAGATVEPGKLQDGYDAYMQYCRPCHGDKGDGHGFSSYGLRPPPRDFTQQMFKFGGVAAPGLPPDSELKRIVRGGLHGTAMLPWDLTDPELDATIQYIKTFPRQTVEEQAKITKTPVDATWKSRWESEKPAEPVRGEDPNYSGPAKDRAIALGRSVFHTKAQCSAACHPNYVSHQELYTILKAATGTEMTEFAPDMYVAKQKDSEYCLKWKPGWKKFDDRECEMVAKVVPADFTRDDLRAGSTVTDLYRTIGSGIAGAGMPPWKGVLSDDELWGLAYYVRSLVELRDTPAGVAFHASLEGPANTSWAPPKAAPPPPPTDEKPAAAPKPPKKAARPRKLAAR